MRALRWHRKPEPQLPCREITPCAGPAEPRPRTSYTIRSTENIFSGDEQNHTTDGDQFALWIQDMKFDTAAEREKLFRVYRERQEATGGLVCPEPEFVDQRALRMLKINFDENNEPHPFLTN